MTTAVKDLQIEESLWATFTSLLDGPTTARGIATRQNRPLARVAYDLDKLVARGLVVERGVEQIGGWAERRYSLPEGAIELYDENALQLCLHQVDRGIRRAKLVELPYVAELATVRLTRPVAHEILQKLRALRDETERANTPDGDARFGAFVAGWLEP